jgi:hypothetical protein
MNSTYISEYVPSKISINGDEIYNETNIMSIIANIEDYFKFIIEVEKAAKNQEKAKDQLFESDFEKLNSEMASKLDILNLGMVNAGFFKTDMKNNTNSPNTSFDDIIKNKALEILNKVNSLTEVR